MATDAALAAIVDRVKAATASGTPLRFRGGGSKDFYGQALQGDILDTRPLSGIVSYEPSELVVTARAGTPLAELEALLAQSGQCLPFEPPHFTATAGEGGEAKVATVGGMVAAGLSGPARGSVGALRDYVLGITILNGQAELLTFGGQVMKNVAGYDVSRLLAGSLGVLGLIVQVSLKVLPQAATQCTLLFEMDEAIALNKLNRWAGQALPVNASCWHDGALMLRLRGARAAVQAAQKTLGGTLMEGREQDLWAGLREQTSPFFTRDARGHEALWRLSLPDTTPPLPLGPTLIEWGGAQRWLKRPASDAALVRAAASAAGGHATLFRGGDSKAVGVFTPLASPLDHIHRALKKQFDPAGIFNRGRLYAEF
jgi:glycolate oxidase FAD binding subunit